MNSAMGGVQKAENQKTMLTGFSVRPRSRSWIEISATMKAAPMPVARPIKGRCARSGPAMITMPASPSSTAVHRHAPIFSPSSTTASSTAKMGAVNPRTVASASGRICTTPSVRNMPSPPISARRAWIRGRSVFRRPTSPRAASQPDRARPGRSCRQNSVSGSQMPCSPVSFTSSSMTEMATIASRRRPSA